MQERINIGILEPNAYKAIFGLENYIADTGLPASLIHLIKLRASQINHCAYCIDMHTSAALKDGETNQRLFAISAWKESPLFSEKEKALFAMTDEITLIANKGLSDNTFNKAKKYFSDNTIAQVIVLIGTINIWNRIAVSTHMSHT